MRSPEEIQTEYNQQNHPEIIEGEMWLTNSSREDAFEIGYSSKRFGNKAYTRSGVIVEGLVPVFISKQEYEEEQKNTQRKIRNKNKLPKL